MFSQNTLRPLLRIEEPHWNQRALRIWTAIEAYLKMLGLGLRVDPHELGVAVPGSALVTVWTKRHASQRVHLFDVDSNHVMAVRRNGAPLRRSFHPIVHQVAGENLAAAPPDRNLGSIRMIDFIRQRRNRC